ncbi:MAG TPA: ATP-dependent 6-phosphofructokinase, partial [Spirochaetota bacterium]|nr:ATP-dependent 6-phosphofructokinase [Spirochaetota bacterium]
MNTEIQSLGKASIPSPLAEKYKNSSEAFVSDSDRVVYESNLKTIIEKKDCSEIISFEKAGPRKEIYFDPSKVKA